ncbi:MAG: hypothetical protein A2096_05595 [Spirochaetes bacterium GWF1_41_5]|nr:MAG: hypothetical protein A2096_05595 [Spirochaetes bacterium GWF1_41_5]
MNGIYLTKSPAPVHKKLFLDALHHIACPPLYRSDIPGTVTLSQEVQHASGSGNWLTDQNQFLPPDKSIQRISISL